MYEAPVRDCFIVHVFGIQINEFENYKFCRKISKFFFLFPKCGSLSVFRGCQHSFIFLIAKFSVQNTFMGLLLKCKVQAICSKHSLQ